MTPEQFRRLSFALIGLFEGVQLDEDLREAFEQAKKHPVEAWTEADLIDNVIAALQMAERAAKAEPRLRGSILRGTLKFAGLRRVQPMRKGVRARAERSQKRARELHDAGNSPNRIAVIMTSERDRDREHRGLKKIRDISPDTVKGWLAAEKNPTA